MDTQVNNEIQADIKAHIDLTSIYGAQIALTTDGRNEWARRSFYDLSLLLLLHDNIHVPLPDYKPEPSELLRYLMETFGDKFKLSNETNKLAVEFMQHLFQQPEVIDYFKIELDLLSINKEYENWIDWHAHNEWRSHIKRLGGMVNESSIPYLPGILSNKKLNITEPLIREINSNTCVEPDICLKDLDFYGRMFTGDVLIRGVYYDLLAPLTNAQVVHHSVRRHVLKSGSISMTDNIPPIIKYLVPILGNLARKAEEKDRIKIWSEDIILLRRKIRDPQTKLPKIENQSEGIIRDSALKFAQDAGLGWDFNWNDEWTEWITIGVGVGMFLVLNRIESIVQMRNIELKDLILQTIALGGAKSLIDYTLPKVVKIAGHSKWELGRQSAKGWGRIFSHTECLSDEKY